MADNAEGTTQCRRSCGRSNRAACRRLGQLLGCRWAKQARHAASRDRHRSAPSLPMATANWPPNAVQQNWPTKSRFAIVRPPIISRPRRQGKFGDLSRDSTLAAPSRARIPSLSRLARVRCRLVRRDDPHRRARQARPLLEHRRRHLPRRRSSERYSTATSANWPLNRSIAKASHCHCPKLCSGWWAARWKSSGKSADVLGFSTSTKSEKPLPQVGSATTKKFVGNSTTSPRLRWKNTLPRRSNGTACRGGCNEAGPRAVSILVAEGSSAIGLGQATLPVGITSDVKG